MPWNDNANPGPWGAPPPDDDRREAPPRRPLGGGKGRGKGGARGPQRTPKPDLQAGLQAALERLRLHLRRFFRKPGGGFRPSAFAGIAAVAMGLWALSGVHVVQPNEQGVVTTFGAYARTEPPGLHYHAPAPIQHVETVPVTSLNRLDIGGEAEAEAPQESLMLTADDNVVDLSFSVNWRVADARRYLFATRDPVAAIKAAAESAMREVVGQASLRDLMATGHAKVQAQAAALMQKILTSWGAGVTIVDVQIRSAGPPQDVAGAFHDVANAREDAASAVNEANAYRDRVTGEAKGNADQIVQSAEADRDRTVHEAKGAAARFDQVEAEYRRAPAVTRERLYIETMERVLAKSNKVIVDSKGGVSVPIVLPPEAFRRKAAQNPETSPETAGSGAQSQPQSQSQSQSQPQSQSPSQSQSQSQAQPQGQSQPQAQDRGPQQSDAAP